MSGKKWLLLAAIIIASVSFYAFDGQQYLTTSFFHQLYQNDPVLTALVFFIIYVVTTALSLPGAAVLTLLSGAIFGLVQGLLLASFASTIGATLAFVLSRTLLRDWVSEKFANYLETINRGVKKDGPF